MVGSGQSGAPTRPFCLPFGIRIAMPRGEPEEIAESLFGGAAEPPKAAADALPWIRPTMKALHFPSETFEELASQLGLSGACEMLLLAVAHYCDREPKCWQKARSLGIPWRQKRWSSLKELQDLYNAGIRGPTLAAVEEDKEDAESSALSILGGPAAAGLSASRSPSPAPAAATAVWQLTVKDVPPQPTGPPPAVPADPPSDGACAAATQEPFLEAERPAETSASSDGSSEKVMLGFPTLSESGQIEKWGSKPKGRAVATQKAAAPAEHFDYRQLRQYGLKIKGGGQLCKFSNKLKYEVELEMPNEFKLKWVYSVPCGNCNWKGGNEGSWMFLDTANAPEYGKERQEWIEERLHGLDWAIITNRHNKRFVCSKCCGVGINV